MRRSPSGLALPRLRTSRLASVALLAAWIAIGLFTSSGAAARLPREGRLDCTFVAVGHGTAVIVELPDGRNLLYDAGRIGTPLAGARSVAGVLWHQGVTHLDAVILSHADADHYNALPDLLERITIGAVYVSPVMFEKETPALDALRQAIEAADVPIREISSVDRLKTPPGYRLEVLHPPPRGIFGSDNANSIVLEIEFSGRRILLPGDLETTGLDDVLAEAPLDCDVVMAPHHGSPRSNPGGFAAWSSPEWVVISGGHGKDVEPVKNAYSQAGATVLHTAESGARAGFDRSSRIARAQLARRGLVMARTRTMAAPEGVLPGGLATAATRDRSHAGPHECGHYERFANSRL